MRTSFRTDDQELRIPMSSKYEWYQPPINPSIKAGQIHIWKINLNSLYPLEDYQQTLSADEQLRAERIICLKKQERFQLARVALRKILSIYMNQPPESIQFKYGPRGKPYVLYNGRPNSIEFNIAHSENLMVTAFTKGIPVGIDLEFNQPVSTKDWIIKRFFSHHDQHRFQNILEQDKEIAFLTAWTKKEAYSKAVGAGLASPPQLNHFEPALELALPVTQYEMYPNSSFWFLRFTPKDNFTAAAAVRSMDRLKPQFWEFSEIGRNHQF